MVTGDSSCRHICKGLNQNWTDSGEFGKFGRKLETKDEKVIFLQNILYYAPYLNKL